MRLGLGIFDSFILIVRLGSRSWFKGISSLLRFTPYLILLVLGLDEGVAILRDSRHIWYSRASLERMPRDWAELCLIVMLLFCQYGKLLRDCKLCALWWCSTVPLILLSFFLWGGPLSPGVTAFLVMLMYLFHCSDFYLGNFSSVLFSFSVSN